MAQNNIVTIQGKYLMAAHRCAGRDESRYILMGVKLTATSYGSWMLESTDSFKLVRIEGRDKLAGKDTDIEIVLPPEVFVGMKAGDRVSFEPDAEKGECKVTTFAKGKSVTRTVRLMEGKYPNTSSLIPSAKIPHGCYRFAPFLKAGYVKDVMTSVGQCFGKDAAVEFATVENEPLKPTVVYAWDDDVSMTALVMPVMPLSSTRLDEARPVGKADERNRELRKELEAAKAEAEMWKEKALEHESEVEKLKNKQPKKEEPNVETSKRIEELEAELKKAHAELEQVWKENATLKAKAPEKPQGETQSTQAADPEPDKGEDAATAVSLETMQEWCEGKGLKAKQINESANIWVLGPSKPYHDELEKMGARWGTSKKFGKGWYIKPTA